MWMTALVAIGAALGDPGGDMCSWIKDGSEYLRHSRDTWVVARVLPDTMRAAGHPEQVSRRRGEPAGLMLAITEVVGHESTGIAAPGSRVAVFLWDLGPSCRWHTRGVELDPGSAHHFPMRLRPETMWAEGVPTFDVIPTSGFDVFPGRSNVHGIEWPAYRELLDRIPLVSEWREDCRPFLEPLTQWRDRHAGRFSGVVVSQLWGSCENVVRARAVGLEREGVSEVPGSVLTWSRLAGCRIRPRWDQSLDAVVGVFHEGSTRRAWTVLCETDSHTRLVVIDEATGELEADLLNVAGSVPDWHLSVVPPEYFDWFRFGGSPGSPDGLDPPRTDAIALRGRLWMTFAHLDGEWVGHQSPCCGMELRMPRER